MNNAKSSLIVLNYNDYDMTQKLVDNVKNYESIDTIVIVDNCSNNQSYYNLRSYYKNNIKVHVIKTDKNGGYSYGNNYGIKYAIDKFNPSVIAVANPDVLFTEETFTHARDTVLLKSYAMVSAVMHDSDDKEVLQPYWSELPSYKFDLLMNFVWFRRKIYKEKHWVNNQREIMDGCMMPGSLYIFNTDALKKIDFFDEGVFLFSEEAIISNKLLKNGYKIGLMTKYSYLHMHSYTIKKSVKEIDRFILQTKSRYYYQKKYNNIRGIKLLMLRIANCIGIFEFSACLFIKRAIGMNNV